MFNFEDRNFLWIFKVVKDLETRHQATEVRVTWLQFTTFDLDFDFSGEAWSPVTYSWEGCCLELEQRS